jgi:hypothetical protein
VFIYQNEIKYLGVKTTAETNPDLPHHDVFLSYSHSDANWVETLAGRLEDEGELTVWLDKWVLIPGGLWQQEMALGLDRASCCVICIGGVMPKGWFK